MDLSIIIVNWNSKDYLQKCLESILAETRELQFEIVVIDSGSFDGCAEMLRDTYPQVRFVQSDKNLGFARANNAAFEVSTGDCVLFLNPDTEVRGNAIKLLHDRLLSLPDAGVVGAKLLNSDGTLQTSCIKSFPNLLNQFLEAEPLRKLFPRSRLWGMAALFDNPAALAQVDVVSGACMIMKRSVFKNAGMFTTEYFMYSEDVDLCLKTRKAGLKNYWVPSAVIVHHGGGSSRSTDTAATSMTSDKSWKLAAESRAAQLAARNTPAYFSSVMMLESRWRFFLHTRAGWYGLLYRTGMCAISMLRIALTLLSWPYGFVTGHSARWRETAGKWYARLRWAIGLERWVQNY